jgi:2-polyprenyl-3-methyl-5-hydroxy-6-metoxy-1,4-benzoquinol methylase
MSLPQKCPLCQAVQDLQSVVTAHVYGGDNREHSFFYCSACDVRYLYPGLTSEEAEHFYATEFKDFMAERSGESGGWGNAIDHIRANESTRLRRMRYLDPNLTAPVKLLEVGCSSGFMLFPLIEAGYQCIGIEPSGVFNSFLKSRNVPVYFSLEQLVEINSDVGFDIIIHFFVLEHIVQPRAFLEAQMALLKPGGKIIFEIPNSADPLYSVYDVPEFERFYWSMAHPWYFSELSLDYLLKQLDCSYKILRDQRYDLSNHMSWARDGRPGGMGRFTQVLGDKLEEDYKKALIDAGKCDTLVAIITKD